MEWGVLSLLISALVGSAPAQPVLGIADPPVAPPAPPPVREQAGGSGGGSADFSLGAAGTLYSIGEPTDEEQFYLELINRARANPTAEAQILRNTTDPEVLNAYRYFNVDLNLMTSQFALLPSVPPLSMNGALSAAARGHSQDMLAHNFQGHYGSDGSDPGARMSRQGYGWITYGENVYASAKTVFHGHAGFEVDWGNGPGGMQTPAGHRASIHNGSFREVGIGVINGVNGGVGPQLVTQDLATRSGSPAFITGVVYYDRNGDGDYDMGEGIGGVTVSVPGASYSAITAQSGGYSVPMSANGSYTVSFSAPGLATATRNASIANLKNVKVDFVPVYAPPVVSGPAAAPLGTGASYTVSPVGAATAYQWKRSKRTPFATLEGAENGLTGVLLTTNGQWTLVAADIRASGTKSFHLAHVVPTAQSLTLARTLRPGSSSSLAFASRLGWSTASQLAKAQISTNAGASWSDLWVQAGSGAAGQTSFSRVTNSLAAYAGAEVMVRFSFDFVGGSYYTGANSGVGWYIDDITVSGAEELTETVETDLGTNREWLFTPANAGDYVLRARARVGQRWFDWGPSLLVSATTAPPWARIVGQPRVGLAQTQFDVEYGGVPAVNLQVETAPSPAGPWAADATATRQTIVPDSRVQITTAVRSQGPCFYRLVIR